MDTIHKYSFSKIEQGVDFEDEIIRRGIPYERVHNVGGRSYHLRIIVGENHPQWIWLDEKADEYEAVNIFTTIFTVEEKLAANWSIVRLNKELGYLEPRNDVKLQKETLCEGCNKFQQSKPFHVSEIKLPRTADIFTIVGLNGLFMTSDVEHEIKKQALNGCMIRDVISFTNNKPIRGIRELVVSTVSSPGIVGWDHLKQPPCKVCGTVKYKPKQKGMMKYLRSAIPQNIDFFLSNEWWGVGFAYQQIIVSARVSKLFIKKGLKGVDTQPIEIVDR